MTFSHRSHNLLGYTGQYEHSFWNLNTDSGKSAKSVQIKPDPAFILRQNQCSFWTRMSVQIGPEYPTPMEEMSITDDLGDMMDLIRKVVNWEKCSEGG